MLNLDTHIVLWLLRGELTDEELDLVNSDSVGISDIVVWEVAMLERRGRIEGALGTPAMTLFLAEATIWPIDAEVALASTQLDFRSDPADALIAATSIVHNAPLLTRDRRILQSKLVPLALKG